MSSEQMKILEMVEAGELSTEEALTLLKNTKSPKQEQNKQEQNEPTIDLGGNSSDAWQTFMGWLESLMDSFKVKATYSHQEEQVLDSEGVVMLIAETSNGKILVEGKDEPQITIHSTIKVQAKDETTAQEFAEQVKIQVNQSDTQLHLYPEHPKPPTGVTVGVSYKITCPRHLAATLTTINGNINVNELTNILEAKTTNGSLKLQNVAGSIQAYTTNGSIKANITTAEKAINFKTKNGAIKATVKNGNIPINATTLNGTINLVLPTDFDGQLEAKTVNGRVSSELAMVSSRRSRNHLSATLGEGGETQVNLQTVNGSIKVGMQNKTI